MLHLLMLPELVTTVVCRAVNKTLVWVVRMCGLPVVILTELLIEDPLTVGTGMTWPRHDNVTTTRKSSAQDGRKAIGVACWKTLR